MVKMKISKYVPETKGQGDKERRSTSLESSDLERDSPLCHRNNCRINKQSEQQSG